MDTATTNGKPNDSGSCLLKSRGNSVVLFRSRFSPTLKEALSVTTVRAQFAAYLSLKGAAALLRYWLEADSRLRSATGAPYTNSVVARKIAQSCGLTTLLSRLDYEKGVSHCQKIVADELQNRYFEDFKASTYFANYQLELLNEVVVATKINQKSGVTLDDVVFCDSSLFYFREFIEQFPGREQSSMLLAMLNFYLAAASFTQEYCSETALSDALTLYEKYLSLNALRPLTVPDSVRRQVELRISVETGQPGPNTFGTAVEHFRNVFEEEGLLKQFINSIPFHEMVQYLRRRSETVKSLSLPAHPTYYNSNNDEDNNSVHSSLSRNSPSLGAPQSSIRRFASLRVARIDELTGTYVSEFSSPQFFECNDSVAVPNSGRHDGPNNNIKRFFSLRGTNASRTQFQKEAEAERQAAEIVGAIVGVTSSTASNHSAF